MTFTAKLKIIWKSVSLHYTVPGGGKLLNNIDLQMLSPLKIEFL